MCPRKLISYIMRAWAQFSSHYQDKYRACLQKSDFCLQESLLYLWVMIFTCNSRNFSLNYTFLKTKQDCWTVWNSLTRRNGTGMPFQLILQPILQGIYAHYYLFMNNIMSYPKLWNTKVFSCCCFIVQSWHLPFSAQLTSLLCIYVISPGPSDTEHYVEDSSWLQPEIRESLQSPASFCKEKTGTILVRLGSWDWVRKVLQGSK